MWAQICVLFLIVLKLTLTGDSWNVELADWIEFTDKKNLASKLQLIWVVTHITLKFLAFVFSLQLLQTLSRMKLFLSSVILFPLSVAAAAAYSSVKPTANSHVKNSQSDMINNYYSANCETKFHQQLAEIKHEIKALRENLAGNGLFSKVKQQLSEVKEEMRALNSYS